MYVWAYDIRIHTSLIFPIIVIWDIGRATIDIGNRIETQRGKVLAHAGARI